MAIKEMKEFQLVLELKPHKVVSRKPIRRTGRSFGGCFSCKRRKIKCDETKSRCKNCLKSDLECVWPVARTKLRNTKTTSLLLIPQPSAPTCHIQSQSERHNFPNVPRVEDITNIFEAGHQNPQRYEPSSSKEELFPVFSAKNTFSTFPVSTALQRNYLFVRDQEIIITEPEYTEEQAQMPLTAENLKIQDNLEIIGTQSQQNHEVLELTSPHHQRSPFYSITSISSPEACIDLMFFANFANRFLPTIAQPHFHHALPQHSLVLSAASQSSMLTEIFIACGASLVAFDNLLYREVAQKKYKSALLHFLTRIKHGVVHSNEDWFFVAVQVLQTLCLRDAFGGANATRCAAHFSAAYKIIVLKVLERPHDVNSSLPQFSPLEKVLIENFIFNYSITIFYCDHTKLEALVPNPFDFFSFTNPKLTQMSYGDGSPQSSRMSMLAFQIAAKCSWLCRLRLPLNPADRRLHYELLLFADTILFSLESVNFSEQEILVQNTVSVAKVVLRTSIILIRKMLDMENVRAHQLQNLVKEIASDIAQPHNKEIIFPIWSLMIAASTSLEPSYRNFYKEKLQQLIGMSRSKIAMQVLNHLEGLWEIYSGDEPFEFLFDTDVLDQVCN